MTDRGGTRTLHIIKTVQIMWILRFTTGDTGTTSRWISIYWDGGLSMEL